MEKRGVEEKMIEFRNNWGIGIITIFGLVFCNTTFHIEVLNFELVIGEWQV